MSQVSRAPGQIWLGHGASGGPETMKAYLQELRRLGLDARALSLPKGAAERAMAPLRRQVQGDLGSAIIGGHSFGARVASMVASETPAAGLVLLSYPLHRPGHPDQLRVEHWPQIRCPALLLSGDRDPFARVDLLRQATSLLARAQLHVYTGARHGLVELTGDVAARIARFAREL